MRFKEEFIFLSWSLLLATSTLWFLFVGFDFSFLKYVFWIVISFVAGVVITDFRLIVLESLLSFLFCVFVMFSVLSLPAVLGTLSYSSLNELVYTESIRIIFYSVFPFMLVVNVIFSILGGYFGENLSASDS